MVDFDPIEYNLKNEERRLLDYLPPVVRQVLDFQQINAATEPEIRLAWQALSRVQGNQFLAEADAAGLGVWERELGLYPKAGDSLAVRRARILAAWLRKPPYTLRWLREWLDGLGGPEGHSERLEDYVLNIQLDYDLLPEPEVLLRDIKSMLLSLRPANTIIELAAIFPPVKEPIYAVGVICGSLISTELPQLVWEQPMQQNINVAAQAENIMLTDLPQLAWRQGFAENIFAAAERGSISETELSEIKGEVR